MNSARNPARDVGDRLSLVNLLLIGLAAWRMAYGLVYEEGPYGLLARIRHWSGIRYDENSEPVSDETGWKSLPAGALSCIYCCSVWTALLATLLSLLHPLLLSPFAASSVALMVHKVAKN